MSIRSTLLLLGALGLIFVALLGCSEDPDETVGLLPEGPITATCEGCHTNDQMLIAVAEPDEPVESEGEG